MFIKIELKKIQNDRIEKNIQNGAQTTKTPPKKKEIFITYSNCWQAKYVIAKSLKSHLSKVKSEVNLKTPIAQIVDLLYKTVRVKFHMES